VKPARPLLVLVAVALTIVPARAGGNLEAVVTGGTEIADAVWNPLAMPIPWKINSQGVINNCNNGNPTCVGGVSPLTLQLAIDGLTAAFATWQNVPTSRAAFTYTGTSAQTGIGLDNVHLITWADTNASLCPTGVVATTPHSHLTANLTLTSANRDLNSDGIIDIDPAVYPNGTVLAAGTIVDVDMAWCPAGSDYVDFPLDATTNTFDMVAVATHEEGHWHGLSHSSLVTPYATMLPFVDVTTDYGNQARTLSQDDVASTSRYYPETSLAGNFGTITGRLFLANGTTPADGVSVTAYNTQTGEMTVQVFSVTRFTSSTALPGSFKIDWLPPGTYYVGVEYFDSTTGTAGNRDDDWWDNNRYNLTIANSNVSAGAQPIIARPEFYSSPETSTDDLADQVAVTVGAGQTVGVGNIIINSDNPPAPTGATPLNMPNGASIQVVFPAGFTFPFFGQSYGSVFANDNGNLTFGPTSTNADTRLFLGPDPAPPGGPVPPRIAFPLTNLDPGVDNQGPSGRSLDAFWRYIPDGVNPQNDRIEFTYLGVPVIITTKSCTAVIRLFRSGRIEMQYRFWSAWWGILGISPGGDGTEPSAAIDLTRQLPFSGTAGQALYEHFEFAQDPINGGVNALRHAFDANGSLLIFTPNAQGGYDWSSPNYINMPPGEVQNLAFSSVTTLGWDALPGAASYNVYRASLGGFVDSDADGAADSYGACLDPGLPANSDTDASTPPAGSVFAYLVTGRNTVGEGTLGRGSSGASRPNTSPCP
jgi:hypothetical protein